MRINGSQSDDERDATELFPHTRRCTENIRRAVTIHGKAVPCSCGAQLRRRTYLFLINRVRQQAYTDAYAMIRHEAKTRSESSRTPQQREAFNEVASWAEELELRHLEE